MVDILVRKYLNKGVEYEDLYQVGSMALVLLWKDMIHQKVLNSPASPLPLMGEIKRYFRDKGWAIKVPRRLKEISSQLTPCQRLYMASFLGCPPFQRWQNTWVILKMKSWRPWKADKPIAHIPLNQTFDDGGEEGEGTVLEKYTGKEEQGYDSFEMLELIKGVLENFTDKEKDVFFKRFFSNETQQDIADSLGVSQITISRLEKKIKERFREAIRA